MRNQMMIMGWLMSIGLTVGMPQGCGTDSAPAVEPISEDGKDDAAGQKRVWYCVPPFVFLCPWTETGQIDQVTFADDDSGHAFVKLMFEERPSAHPLNGTTDKRNFRHQVFVQDQNGANRRAVTAVQSFQDGATLYYMKRSGYLLVDTLEGADRLRYDVIRLDGRIQTLRTWSNPGQMCAGLEVIPSPDGQLIASIERVAGAPSGDLFCAPGRAKVELYDAFSFAVVARYDWAVKGMIESTWNLQGELIVHEMEAGSFKMTRTQPPLATDNPKCIHPRTTSSIISSTGQIFVPGPSEQNPVNVLPVDDAVPFGCQ